MCMQYDSNTDDDIVVIHLFQGLNFDIHSIKSPIYSRKILKVITEKVTKINQTYLIPSNRL